MHDAMEDSEDKSAQDQMLIERDGKFKLVNASDVQMTMAQLQDGEVGVAPSSQIMRDQNGGEAGASGATTDSVRDSNTSILEPKQTKFTGQSSCEKVIEQQSPLAGNGHSVVIAEAKSIPSVNKTESSVGEMVLSAASTDALGREKRVNHLVGRTKSAPGLRGSQEEENREEQRKRNEAAFSAWLAKKDEELVKRRQLERQEYKMNEERLIQKQTLNEAAYRAWLEKKTTEQQIKRKNASRPTTSVPKVDEAKKQVAFEAWIDSKRDQYHKKIGKERQTRTCEQEKAKNADPTVVQQAYKRLVPLLR